MALRPWFVLAPLLGAPLMSAAAPAQVRSASPEARGLSAADFPRLVPLARGVYGYEELRAPGFTTVSLIVVGTNGVLVADGQGSPAATRAMLERIRTITDRPVRWYVVGSDHGDHSGGNAELPRDIRWVVHPASRAQLLRDSAAAAAANAKAAEDARTSGQPAPAPRIVVVPPAAMTGARDVVDVGGMTVEVRFLGRAHTGGDLSVYLPRQKVLFMSEAFLNRVFPAMRSAYPSEWVRTIDRALALDVERFVPGHGFIEEPMRSREDLVAFQAALRAVIAEGTRLHALGLTAEDALTRAEWGEYGAWFLREQQAPIAVRRIYDELEGRLR